MNIASSNGAVYKQEHQREDNKNVLLLPYKTQNLFSWYSVLFIEKIGDVPDIHILSIHHAKGNSNSEN